MTICLPIIIDSKKINMIWWFISIISTEHFPSHAEHIQSTLVHLFFFGDAPKNGPLIQQNYDSPIKKGFPKCSDEGRIQVDLIQRWERIYPSKHIFHLFSRGFRFLMHEVDEEQQGWNGMKPCCGLSENGIPMDIHGYPPRFSLVNPSFSITFEQFLSQLLWKGIRPPRCVEPNFFGLHCYSETSEIRLHLLELEYSSWLEKGGFD